MVERNELTVTLRAAEISDCRSVYDWRYQDDAAQFYKSTHVPTYADHNIWFEDHLNIENTLLLMGNVGDKPVSHLRIDQIEDGYEISICVDPQITGQGIGAKTLEAAITEYLNKAGRFIAYIHCENHTSLRLFRSCGFEMIDQKPPFMRLERK